MKAPISAAERKQLKSDAHNVRATASRKGYSLDQRDEAKETTAANSHFELGCWLFYYRDLVYESGPDGLRARIDCAKRLFLSCIFNPRDDFYTVFDFGERHFDTIFEMDDGGQVRGALRKLIPRDRTGYLAEAFKDCGWDVKKGTNRSSRVSVVMVA